MVLTGQAKRDYQREYMRSYMRRRRAVKTPTNVKTQPTIVKTQTVKTQSYNPMMVGYVPPKE